MKLTLEQKLSAKRMPPFIKQLRAAIRADEKTVTRRLSGLEAINESPDDWTPYGSVEVSYKGGNQIASQFIFKPKAKNNLARRFIKNKYGEKDEIHFLIEPIRRYTPWSTHYADDGKPVHNFKTREPILWDWKKDMLTSIHMPTACARTFVRYKSVRIERLHKITLGEINSEGIANPTIEKWIELWNSINGKTMPWMKNPWVWRIEWERIK